MYFLAMVFGMESKNQDICMFPCNITLIRLLKVHIYKYIYTYIYTYICIYLYMDTYILNRQGREHEPEKRSRYISLQCYAHTS